MPELNYLDILGFLAGLLTTVAFIPQLVRTWNTKSAEDVSLGMFILFILGVMLWCIYGFEIHSIPVVVANVITTILAGCILTLKLIYTFTTNKELK